MALAWVVIAPLVPLAAIVVLVFGPTRLAREPAAELPEARVSVPG